MGRNPKAEAAIIMEPEFQGCGHKKLWYEVCPDCKIIWHEEGVRTAQKQLKFHADEVEYWKNYKNRDDIPEIFKAEPDEIGKTLKIKFPKDF